MKLFDEGVVVEIKVRTFDDPWACSFPRRSSAASNTKDGAPLYLVEAPDGGYRIVPHDPCLEAKIAKSEDIIDRYRSTLHVLAQVTGNGGRFHLA